VFREAVALVFAAEKGDEVQIAFAIDGKLSEAHERSFAENSGPRKMGFVKALSESDVRKRLERMVGRDVLRACQGRSEMSAAFLAVVEAETEVRSIRPAAERGGRGNPSVAALSAAKAKLSVAKHTIESMPVRPLACFEQNELLEEAVANARSSILITSAGLQPTIVNGFMIRRVDQLAEAQVAVVIETQLTPQLEPRGGDHFDPLSELTGRANRGLLRFIKGPRRDLFFLIQDEDLAVVSNRPFLGEVTRRSGFIKMTGLVARRPEYVRLIRETAASSSREGGRLA